MKALYQIPTTMGMIKIAPILFHRYYTQAIFRRLTAKKVHLRGMMTGDLLPDSVILGLRPILCMRTDGITVDREDIAASVLFKDSGYLACAWSIELMEKPMNSKRNKKIIFFAGAGVLWAVLIMSICVISSKLPAQLSLLDFAEGIMEVDLKKQPFAEVAPNIYFHKDGNMDEIINYLSNDGMILDEQFGSSYIFTNGKETIHASTMAITRWHKILILNNN